MTEEEKQKLNEKLDKWCDWQPAWYGDIPNFTDSLDACFKWLVPKLPKGYRVALFSGEINYAAYFYRNKDIYSKAGAGAETPELALCLAIEKLIDNEQ